VWGAGVPARWQLASGTTTKADGVLLRRSANDSSSLYNGKCHRLSRKSSTRNDNRHCRSMHRGHHPLPSSGRPPPAAAAGTETAAVTTTA
jgi:hypothetical protein